MKIFRKISAVAFVFVYTLGLAGVAPAHAVATDPGLVAAASFSVLAQTLITGVSTISGDVGMNGSGANITALTTADVAGTIYATDLVAPSEAILDPAVQANASAVYTVNIPGQPTDGTIVGALDGQVFTTGVYDQGAILLGGGTVTLDGPGVYIFRASTTLTSSGTVNLINGARACDVYWNVGTAAAINGSTFVGTILAGSGVHFGADVDLDGRALAVGADVTFAGSAPFNGSISGPSCAPSTGTIAVNKVVVNDDGGSSVIADFPLFVGGTPVSHGVATTLAPATYTVTETGNVGYAQSFSGDCDANGDVILGSGDILVCTITNDDIEQSSGGGGSSSIVPPLIDVVKVPSPLALPAGPGSVLYTFTVRNIGPVAMTNVTTVDDSCGPLTLVSGDSNTNAVLEVSETWTYTCTATLPATHTNTVTATGWANGMNAVDVAVATVVVGGPVPPLIHVTKVPNPLSLAVAGGLVTYTERITNPGPLALSNVTLTDDKCGPVVFISGDVDGDAQLDTTETWTYTCQRNLNQTTTNTATATGQANGITVTDFAIATVVVGVPGFPSTGVVPEGQGSPWNILGVGMLVLFTASLGATLRKRTV